MEFFEIYLSVSFPAVYAHKKVVHQNRIFMCPFEGCDRPGYKYKQVPQPTSPSPTNTLRDANTFIESCSDGLIAETTEQLYLFLVRL
ncbi:hypothetical protein KIN20_016748 [Parelaphostrongylus tenuis]|uniref:Uncharacterized protein n=1 Tax=Parelaphostrongylus tenuis TaxID=148309 RepID=A0AAD5N291_PARTN|nr:hypothetical protein KIN20_016748 [Parelaphostrongylus tenuis]